MENNEAEKEELYEETNYDLITEEELKISNQTFITIFHLQQ